MVHNRGKIVIVAAQPLNNNIGYQHNLVTPQIVSQNIPHDNSCLVNPTNPNGGCHNHGLVNYKTTLPCNRCNVTPLYVQEICQQKANGCSLTYDQCVKKLSCSDCNTNLCKNY